MLQSLKLKTWFSLGQNLLHNVFFLHYLHRSRQRALNFTSCKPFTKSYENVFGFYFRLTGKDYHAKRGNKAFKFQLFLLSGFYRFICAKFKGSVESLEIVVWVGVRWEGVWGWVGQAIRWGSEWWSREGWSDIGRSSCDVRWRGNVRRSSNEGWRNNSSWWCCNKWGGDSVINYSKVKW